VEKFEKNIYLTVQDALIAAVTEGEDNFPEKVRKPIMKNVLLKEV